MRFAKFCGTSYQPLNSQFDSQRTINLYPEADEQGTGKDGEITQLLPTPGLTNALSNALTGNKIRGLYTTTTGHCYAVCGSNLYEISNNITSSIEPVTATLIGSLSSFNPTYNPVSMADNGVLLCIVDGNNYYSLTIGNNASFVQGTDSNFLGSNIVINYDGYFIFVKPNSNIFYWANINTLTFNGLNYDSKSGSGDNIEGIILFNRQLWLIGTRTTEVWFNSPLGGTIFQRIQGAFIEVGCISYTTIQKFDNGIIWVASNSRGTPYIVQTSGYSAKKISTFPIDIVLQTNNLYGSSSFIYEQSGHIFYQFNPINGVSSWIYDITMSSLLGSHMWHEKTYFNNGNETRHLAENHCVLNNIHLVGDYNNNKIYFFDINNYTDNGSIIKRTRIAPHLSSENKRIFYNMFQLDCAVGNGILTGQGSNPLVMLRFSNDGGKTWSSIKTKSIGTLGEYFKQVEFFNLGYGRNRVFEITFTDPCFFAIMGANLELQVGNY